MRVCSGLVGLFALLAMMGPASAQRAGDFDYYVLSLSWSPSFCQTKGHERGDPQCTTTRPFGFVLHGLWPQYERGFPEFCDGRQPPRIPEGTISRMLDIMPSRGLIIHEWRKHGTCSGLNPQAYFDTARRAFSSIKIPDNFRAISHALTTTPDKITTAFQLANPNLSRDGFSLVCQSGRLDEVRICLSRTLQPRRCSERAQSRCTARNLEVPTVNQR